MSTTTSSKKKEKDAQSVSTYGSASTSGSKNPVKAIVKKIFGGQRRKSKQTGTKEGVLETAAAAKAKAKSNASSKATTSKATTTGGSKAKATPKDAKASSSTMTTLQQHKSSFITKLHDAVTKVEETTVSDVKSAGQKSSEYLSKVVANSESIKKISPPVWHRARTQKHQTVFKREGDGVTELGAVTSMPPDAVMDKYMTVLLTKQVDGITVSQLYEKCWKGDLYKKWLVKDGKINITVGEWEMGEFKYPQTTPKALLQDADTYSQRRTVKYSYKRDPKCLGYHLGKPQVDVTQTMYYKQIDDQRSILAICMDTTGDVCSDCFRVHIRGVFTKAAAANGTSAASASSSTSTLKTGKDSTSLLVDFAVATEFVKRTVLSKQIRGVVEDATNSNVLTLFNLILQTSGASETIRSPDALEPASDPYEGDDDNGGGQKCCFLFGC